MKAKILYSVLLFSSLILACKDKENRGEITAVTSDVAYNNFVKSSGNDYLVLSQQKIRLLNAATPAALNISSTLPVNEIPFEIVYGNRDTLYVQAKDGIHLFTVNRGEGSNWTETAVIKDVLPCDKFIVNFPLLVTSKGSQLCAAKSGSTDLVLYDISNLSNPKIRFATTTVSPVALKGTASSFYLLTQDNNLIYSKLQSDSTLISTNVLSIASPKSMDIFGNKLLISAKNKVFQYDISDRTKPLLESTITTAQ